MKMLKNLALLLVLATLLWNCAGKSEEEKAKEEPKNALEALEKIGQEAEKMSKEGPKETVDAKLLKELLPADADGLTRKEASSEKTAAMGFGISKAEARYANDNESINVEILDVAGAGVALMGMAAWSLASVEKETETGYEKTTEYEGHKAYEKYNTKSQDGEISVLVANRYIVNVSGNNTSMDKIKATLDDIDLDKLADLQ
jgi:hypothetical protein